MILLSSSQYVIILCSRVIWIRLNNNNNNNHNTATTAVRYYYNYVMKIERERLEFFGKRDVYNFFISTDIGSFRRTRLRGVSPNVKGLPTRKTRLIRRSLKMDFSPSKLAGPHTLYYYYYYFLFFFTYWI